VVLDVLSKFPINFAPARGNGSKNDLNVKPVPPKQEVEI
jgi:hypothetical protein